MWPLITHFLTCHMNSCLSSIPIAHGSMPCRSTRSGKQGDSIWNLLTSLEISKTVIKDLVKRHYFRKSVLKIPIMEQQHNYQALQPSNVSSSIFAAIATDDATDPRNHVSDNV